MKYRSCHSNRMMIKFCLVISLTIVSRVLLNDTKFEKNCFKCRRQNELCFAYKVPWGSAYPNTAKTFTQLSARMPGESSLGPGK